jgi:hypothetical protein
MTELTKNLKTVLQDYEKLKEKEEENEEMQEQYFEKDEEYNQEHTKFRILKCITKSIFSVYFVIFLIFSCIILTFFIIIFPFDWENKTKSIMNLLTIIAITSAIKITEFLCYLLIFFICLHISRKERRIY